MSDDKVPASTRYKPIGERKAGKDEHLARASEGLKKRTAERMGGGRRDVRAAFRRKVGGPRAD